MNDSKQRKWNNAQVREYLRAHAEERYRRHVEKLTPGSRDVLGVKMGTLRRLAKQIARGDWRDYLENGAENSFEERMLKGLVLCYAPTNITELIDCFEGIMPMIDNWAICDSACAGYHFNENEKDTLRAYIASKICSDKEFEVRFALVMLLYYYMEQESLDFVFSILTRAEHPGYYARMAAAWLISIAYIQFEEQTAVFLSAAEIHPEVIKKAVQKIKESRVPDRASKQRAEVLLREITDT